MTQNAIARRYAGALFALGKKHGGEGLDERGGWLSELARLGDEEPKFRQALKSPVISADEKKALLAKVLELMGADGTTRNFCFLLADKERLGVLPQIAEEYGVLLDETRGILRGRVTTAIKLSPERQEELKADLEKKTGKNLSLVFDVDPEILGGMVLTVGGKVLDSSLRAQLGAMREILRRGI